jgi:hypothetical protein
VPAEFSSDVFVGQSGRLTQSPQLTGDSTASCARQFLGTRSQVPQARRFLAGQLGDFPQADEALLCLSELVANAVQHSNSRCPGGNSKFAQLSLPAHYGLRFKTKVVSGMRNGAKTV